jgi:hypothetical protein
MAMGLNKHWLLSTKHSNSNILPNWLCDVVMCIFMIHNCHGNGTGWLRIFLWSKLLYLIVIQIIVIYETSIVLFIIEDKTSNLSWQVRSTNRGQVFEFCILCRWRGLVQFFLPLFN